MYRRAVLERKAMDIAADSEFNPFTASREDVVTVIAKLRKDLASAECKVCAMHVLLVWVVSLLKKGNAAELSVLPGRGEEFSSSQTPRHKRSKTSV